MVILVHVCNFTYVEVFNKALLTYLSTSQLMHVTAHPLATIGCRSIPFAASSVWNSLPSDVVVQC